MSDKTEKQTEEWACFVRNYCAGYLSQKTGIVWEVRIHIEMMDFRIACQCGDIVASIPGDFTRGGDLISILPEKLDGVIAYWERELQEKEKNEKSECAVCERTMVPIFFKWFTGSDFDNLDLCGQCFFQAVELRTSGKLVELFLFLRLDEVEIDESWKWSPPLASEIVLDIRWARHDGQSIREIARKQLIDPKRISNLTRGVTYQDVAGPIFGVDY